MEKRTSQEEFDIVVKHLEQQKKRSVDTNGVVCLYRGPNGAKCAVGALIPDDVKLTQIQNRMSVFDLRDYGFSFALEFWKLSRLQGVHDDPSNWDDKGFTLKGKDRLRGLAQEFSLEYKGTA